MSCPHPRIAVDESVGSARFDMENRRLIRQGVCLECGLRGDVEMAAPGVASDWKRDEPEGSTFTRVAS